MDWSHLQQVNEEMIGTVNIFESKIFLRKHQMNIKQTSSAAAEASQGIRTAHTEGLYQSNHDYLFLILVS